MLDTGSTVNFISKRQVSRFATYYNIDESSWLIEVADNLEINLQSLNNARNLKAQVLKFRLTKPANNWVEAIVLDDIHPFPKLELDEIITRSYEMNGPFPRSEGSVDILLGVADSLKLLKEKHFLEEILCFTVHSLRIRALWESTGKGFDGPQLCPTCSR